MSRHSACLVGHLPFYYRFNAYPEIYLDSLENPAYATGFRTTEAQLFFTPAVNGLGGLVNSQASTPSTPSNYSFSPQPSAFSPFAGGRWVAGGSVTMSQYGAGVSSGRFSSTSFVLANTIGEATAVGFGIDRQRGSGADSGLGASNISQQRFTMGVTRDLSPSHKVGFYYYYRYGFVDASNTQSVDSTLSYGHSSEVGLRLRGSLTPRLFYGVSASWLGVSLADRQNGADVGCFGRRLHRTRGPP